MAKNLVVYTDPAWAVDGSGNPDPALAGIERKILGNETELRLGVFENGCFVTSGPQFIDSVAGADAIVIYRAEVDAEMVEAIKPTVKVVGRQGVGFENLNAYLLEESGIYGFNVPDYCVDEVPNHTIALLLGLERNIVLQNNGLKGGTFNIFTGGYPRRLQDLTVGIIGLGRIGLATTRKIQAFYGRVIAYDPYVHRDRMKGHGVEKKDKLAELARESDVVILHCLMTAETENIIDAEFVSNMKNDALLLNTARGKLVSPEAVYKALLEKRIGGYASDVFSPEDPNEHPINKKILEFENVLVTSHRSFLSRESEISQRERVAETVQYVLSTGKPPIFGNLTPGLP